MADRREKRPQRFGLVHILLVFPFIAMLSVGFYNRTEPALAGIPFFYWFQMLWIPLGAILLWPIFRSEERERNRRDR